MTASYPDLDLTQTKSDKMDEICLGTIIPVNDQEIRNLWDKTKCVEANGVVAKCNSYGQSFTTVRMVNNLLNN